MRRLRIAVVVAVALSAAVAVPALAGGGHSWSPFRGDHSLDEVSINGYAGTQHQSGCITRLEPLALVPGPGRGFRLEARLRMQCDDVGLRFSKVKWTHRYLVDDEPIYDQTNAVTFELPWTPLNSTWKLNTVSLPCKEVNPGRRGSYVAVDGTAWVSVWDTTGTRYKTNQLTAQPGGVTCPALR
jgi:hypothetical protein